MAGSTISTPFGLTGGGGGTSGVNEGGNDVVGPMKEVIGQVQGQTSDFAGKLQDPKFTGQSEMGEMLKLQRAVSLETMMFTTVSNLEKARTDASKGAIQNMK